MISLQIWGHQVIHILRFLPQSSLVEIDRVFLLLMVLWQALSLLEMIRSLLNFIQVELKCMYGEVINSCDQFVGNDRVIAQFYSG